VITLTPADNLAAIDRLLAAWRVSLADARWSVQVHRDVLNSPAEHVTALEAQAIQASKAIAYLEGERAKLASTPSTGSGTGSATRGAEDRVRAAGAALRQAQGPVAELAEA